LIFPLLLALLLGLGAFLRFVDLSQPLLDFHPTRQLFSAVKARGMYYQTLPNASFWQKDISYRQWQGEATIEPPVVENIAVFFYKLSGQENTAYPRAVSAAFWLITAVFLFWLARNLVHSTPAALFSVAFFLLTPYSIPASRSFQPDPLMVLFIIIFWWAIQTWSQQWPNPRWHWAILAGLVGGFAIFIKLTAVFFIIGGALGPILAHLNLYKSLKNPQTWLIMLLGVLPAGFYLYDGLYISGVLSQQFGGRFFPGFWIDPYFYLRWLLKVDAVVGLLGLSLALLSWLVFAAKPAKIVLAAPWLGYFIYGLVFPHHISSHDYYSLPLIPLAALSFAPLAREIAVKLEPSLKSRFSWGIFFLLFAFFLTGYASLSYLAIRQADTRPLAQMNAEIGEIIQHQPGILALTEEYGYPLAYYGWQNVSLWPPAATIEDYRQVFARQTKEKAYFLVTDFAELARQPQLLEKLTEYTIFAQSRGYVIYDLKAPRIQPNLPETGLP
jgi:4-amino-4-deoxy-L-arabinose transferase-like glycosyltransferase